MLKPDQQLSTTDHRRDLAGMTYVYPVVSRRAGGVSVGINLNPNNACNWRCIYCQVENLQRGPAPTPDLAVLEEELRAMLSAIVHGDFMANHVPEPLRRLNDIALSGNGEPTTSPRFGEVLQCIGRVMHDFGLHGRIRVVLITNGSQTLKPPVQAGLRLLAELGGEVWFKLDRGDAASMRDVNQVSLDPQRVLRQLDQAAQACPVWIQSCFFAWDGAEPSQPVVDAYLRLLGRVCEQGIPVRGVLLYGVARPSMQPEAARISALSSEWMDSLAQRIHAIGLEVRVSP